MTTLLLIRHGESKTNRLKRFAGQNDIELNELGHLQAAQTAKYVTERYKIDRIYSSDLSRAYHTAKPISEILGLDITTYKELREVCVGNWQGKDFEVVEKLYPEGLERWRNCDIDYAPENGESRRQLLDRGMYILKKIAEENEGKTVAVATHGGLIRCVQTVILYGELEKVGDVVATPNASVTELLYDNGKFEIKVFNENSHLTELNENYENTILN